MDIYIHIGILKYDVNDTIIREDGDKAVSVAEREYRDEYDADAGFVEYNGWSDDKSNGFFDRSFIGLTYTETVKYIREWQKQFSILGPTVNMEEVEREDIDYSKKYSLNTFLELVSPLEDSIDKYGKLENDPDIKNESIEFYRKIGLINDKNEVLTYSEYENYYENNEENIKKYI